MAAISPQLCSDGKKPEAPAKTDRNIVQSDFPSQNDDNALEAQDPNKPKGVRFALLYLCILIGSFGGGYVRDIYPVSTE